MEGVSASVYKGLKGLWKRRGYERLNGASRRRKNRVELAGGRDGEGSNRRGRRRFWRIKITPKLRRFSPKKFFIGMRDAYVNFMLRIANSPLISGGYGGVVDDSFGRRPMKEYDDRMIIEIYKSIIGAQGVVPCDAARISGHMKVSTH